MVRVLTAVVTIISLALTTGAQAQQPFTVSDLAQYRLTNAAFTPFALASRSIAAVTRADPALERDPLFTREIMLSDDARAAATALETRLLAHPAIVRALDDAKLSARDYTKFALALFAARLAHGFVKAGVLRRVPDGAAAENVAFVEAHVDEITALLAELGIDG
jgi:hypothetical protein